MAKDSKKLKVRLPRYKSPRNKWRKEIISGVDKALGKKIKYTEKDRLELEVLFYFDDLKVSLMDVDNRLKDVMDALQGRFGGPKSKKKGPAIIPNDSQIFKVTVEKRRSPKQSKGEGHLLIRKYRISNK
jgi:Holliday junction resolvase RusA-like endonuclease